MAASNRAAAKSFGERFSQRRRVKAILRERRGDDPDQATYWEEPSEAVSFGHWAIITALVGFMAWAFLAPLAEGIPASGVVAVESKHKVVTTLAGGVIKSVHVGENQTVKEGEVLIIFDDVRQRANADAAEKEYAAAAVKLARLEAEQANREVIIYPPDVRPYLDTPWGMALAQAQESLFMTRRRALESERAILQETLAATQSMVRGARAQLESRNQQAASLKEEIGGLKSMVSDGYAPRNQLLDRERTLAEINSISSDLHASVARGISNSAEIRLRQIQRQQEFLRDVDAQITDSRREIGTLVEKVKAAREELDRTIVRAPVTGQAVRLEGLNSGSSVAPTSRLFEIIPSGDRLLIDASIPTHIGNTLQPGLIADVRISAFPDDPQLVVEGAVLSVSSDRHVDSGSGTAFYLARIQITRNGLAQLGKRRLQAGMPVDVVIKTGERNFITYLMTPLLRRMSGALHEP